MSALTKYARAISEHALQKGYKLLSVQDTM
jgi:hypothetical protein